MPKLFTAAGQFLAVIFLSLPATSSSQTASPLADQLSSQLRVTPLPVIKKELSPCDDIVPYEAYLHCQITFSHSINQLRFFGDPKYSYLIQKSTATKFFAKHPDQMPSLEQKIGYFFLPDQIRVDDSLSPKIFNDVFKQRNRSIYFLLFSSSLYQDLAMERMATYIESLTSKIMDDRDLGSYLATTSNERGSEGGGYDFRLLDVANFFESASSQKVQLNSFEQLFLDQLRQLHLISSDGFKILESDVAIISTSQHASISDRNHEFNHGLYFTDIQYRRASRDLFKNLPLQKQKEAIDLLQSISPFYNFKNDEDLAIREFIAWYRDRDELLNNYVDQTFKPLVEDLSNRVHTLDILIPEYMIR